RAVNDAPAAGLKEKTKGGEIGAIFLPKPGARMRQMRGGKSGDPHVAHCKGLGGLKRPQLQTELERFIEQESGVEHRPERFDGAGRQMNSQRLRSTLQPAALQ